MHERCLTLVISLEQPVMETPKRRSHSFQLLANGAGDEGSSKKDAESYEKAQHADKRENSVALKRRATAAPLASIGRCQMGRFEFY